MRNRAYTLLETVIVIGIVVAIMTALVTLYVKFNRLYVYQQTYSASAYEAGRAVNMMSAAILPAHRVLASHTFDSQSLSSSASVLVLSLPTVNASGTIVPGAYDYVGFYLSGTDLYRVVSTDAASVRTAGTQTIASSVSSLAFTYDNSDFTQVTNVTVEVATQANTQQGLVTSNLRNTFYLRNI